ncbi:MAG: DUF6512 family protein [Vallitaleaceae bacterium]|jgi:hypothetical protein|nr:DUF6512 family protein [Vallitaleaceae bacterium]
MKNNRKLLFTTLIGLVIILSIATIWHFIYGWFPSNILALIAPVNESPWEHVKMFFVPPLIWYAIEYIFVGKKYDNYLFARGIALIYMPVFMFSVFYGYRDILGIPEKLIYDSIITAVAIWTGSVLAYWLTIRTRPYKKKAIITPIIVAIMLISYSILTFLPPKAPVFYDRNFDGYGIDEAGHDHDHI